MWISWQLFGQSIEILSLESSFALESSFDTPFYNHREPNQPFPCHREPTAAARRSIVKKWILALRAFISSAQSISPTQEV